MFTLQQITEIHDRLAKAETLTHYLQALKEIGVETVIHSSPMGMLNMLGNMARAGFPSSPLHRTLLVLPL